MISHGVRVGEQDCNKHGSLLVSVCKNTSILFIYFLNCAYFVCITSALEAAGHGMSFPGDPEDCSKCVSVSLINSNTRAFGTCGQVNETQWEGTFSWFPPCQEAVGDGMRFSSSPRFSLSSPPLHQRGGPIPSLGARAVETYDSSAVHPTFFIISCWFSITPSIYTPLMRSSVWFCLLWGNIKYKVKDI